MKSLIIVMVAITLTSARVITPNAISSILQDILSPANTDKNLQLIKVTSARPNYASPEIARVCGELPARFTPGLPARQPVCVASDYPRTIVSEKRQAPVREVRRVFQPNAVEPIFQTLQQEIARPCLAAPGLNPYLPVSSPLSSGFNPYLPISSPVSAMLPGNLPPPTQSRGQFLRKIPIPPPTI